MENSNFLIIAAAAVAITWLHVLWLHRKLTIWMRDVAEESADTFIDFLELRDRVEDLEVAVRVDVKDLIDKKHKNLKLKLNAGGEDIFRNSLFIKKSLFNLDIPKNKNVSPEALQDLFDNLIQQRWWKKPRNED